jgi:hypothetical protein
MDWSNLQDYDTNLYIGHGVFVLLYVDDVLIIETSSDTAPTKMVQTWLENSYKMENPREVKQFLGFSVRRTKNGITLNQNKHITTAITKYGVEEACTIHSPLEPNIKLDNPYCEDHLLSDFHKKHYQSIVGSLMFIAMGTRPDISHAISMLSSFNSRLTSTHLTVAKRVLRYLKTTRHLCLTTKV